MSVFTITSRTTTYLAAQSDSLYQIAAGQRIEVDNDDGIRAQGPMSGLSFQIDGDVMSYGETALAGGSGQSIQGLEVHVGTTGSLYSEFAIGLAASGAGASIVNEGYIHGGSMAVRLSGADMEFQNTGVVLGGEYAILNNSGGLDLLNDGTIIADMHAISLTGPNATANIVNHGTIRGEDGISLSGGLARVVNSGSILSESVAIHLGSQGTVINSGNIVGNISLSGAGDRFVFKGGSVVGQVMGHNGDDTYVVKATGVDLRELADEGGDRVIATVDWTLGDNFEFMTLLGEKAISGTGNELSNIIDGSRGNNVISGMGGDDYLTGMGGLDKLYGGEGADSFNFVFKSDGKAVVMDFENGIDHMDMFFVEGIDGFEDLMKNHLKVTGDDLRIHAAGQTIVIKDTDKSELDATDFSF